MDYPEDPCPFCTIASAFKPISPLASSASIIKAISTTSPITTATNQTAISISRNQGKESTIDPIPKDQPDSWDPEQTVPPSFVILSTPNIIAFFDIAPLTRGHVLIAPRSHKKKLGDLGVTEAAELGKWLPIVSRAVVKAVLGVDHTDADWNVVQNNGARAAQVIPHVHFHIIPRPATGGVPTIKQSSWTMFGRGMRNELDEEYSLVLAAEIRQYISEEVLAVREREGVDLCAGWAGSKLNKDQGRFGKGRL